LRYDISECANVSWDGLHIGGWLGHVRARMVRASRHTNDSIGERLRDSSPGEIPGIESEIVKIVRALARAAAREDHRKALEANAMSPTEAGKK
jgi:hypothetical protein